MRNTTSKLLAAAACFGTAYYVTQQIIRTSRWVSLTSKIAVVVGGSRGLGLAIARKLARSGVKIALCARNREDLRDAASELRDQGADVLECICDVRDSAAAAEMIERVIRFWGRIDFLFNVAGIMQVGPLEEMTVEDFEKAMKTNCFGALHTMLAAAPHMRKQKFGRIVNIASIGGKQAVPHMAPYDASKFALVGLSRALRTELAKDGILVTTACPTLMRTGSPRNAEFKGRHREEYAWFSLGGALPLFSVDADRAAAQVISAAQYGDCECYISNFLNPPVLAARLFPVLTQEVLTLLNRLLPRPGGIGRKAAFGYESQSNASPSWLTSLNEKAAQNYNQLRPRPSHE